MFWHKNLEIRLKMYILKLFEGGQPQNLLIYEAKWWVVNKNSYKIHVN